MYSENGDKCLNNEIKLPNRDMLAKLGAFPSRTVPSDHMPLGAVFTIGQGHSGGRCGYRGGVVSGAVDGRDGAALGSRNGGLLNRRIVASGGSLNSMNVASGSLNNRNVASGSLDSGNSASGGRGAPLYSHTKLRNVYHRLGGR